MTDNPQAALHLHERQKRVRRGEEHRGSTSAVPAGGLETTEEVRLETPESDLPRTQRTSRDGGSRKGLVDQALGRPAPGVAHTHGRDSQNETGGRIPARGWEKVSTLRGRVRAVRRFLKWLDTNHNVTYPQSVEQFLENLSARHSEPCNQGSLKNAHEATVFLEESSAVPAERRFTGLNLYSIGFRGAPVERPPGKHGQTGAPNVHHNGGGPGGEGDGSWSLGLLQDPRVVDSGSDMVHTAIQ